MFGLFKKQVKPTSLSASVDNIVAVFNTTVTQLSNVETNACTKIQENDAKIKALVEEKDDLQKVIKRASSIREKLSKLIE